MSFAKRAVGLGAVAALTIGAPKISRSPDPIRPPGTSSSVRKLPPLQQATIVAQLFRGAKSVEQFQYADTVWSDLRPSLTKYETSLNCKDYGASHDKEIAISLVGEMVNKPVDLMLDVGKLVLALAGGEKDETLEALKDATKELAKEIGKEKGKELANDIAHHLLPPSGTNRFKEALLKYLQSKSKRSRKYFLQIITDIEDVAKAYGGLGLKVVGALAPSRINPEECGLVEWVERERSDSLRRVFATLESKPSVLRKP